MIFIILTSITSKQKVAQSDWKAIAERLHMEGKSGAPLHFKIKANHVDLARNDVERQGLKLEDIRFMVVPRQSYLSALMRTAHGPLKR